MALLPAGVQGGVAAWGGLAEFRLAWYRCLGRWADALFELTDAVLCAGGPVGSLPRLSLEPVCRRGHGSVYAALAGGQIDAAAVADLLAACRPRSWPLVFAVDATTWPRAAAETSPGRGLYYHPSRQTRGKPVVPGWCYQLVSQLNFGRDSWTWPAGARRIPARADAAMATVAQVRDVLARLGGSGDVPLFVFDAGSSYDPAWLTHELAGGPAQLLVRLRKNRGLFGDPAPRGPHTSGRAGRHPRLARLGRWASCAPAPIVRGWVLHVQVTSQPKRRDVPGTMWLWWSGPAGTVPDLDLCRRAYLHRFDIEHTILLPASPACRVTLPELVI